MSVRVAIVADDAKLRAWQARCVEALAAAGATIAGVLVVDAGRGSEGEDAPALRRGEIPAALRAAPRLARSTIDADVVLWLGAGRPPDGLAGGARHGVWWFRFATPIAFWELLRGDDAVSASLERVGAGAIKAGWFETTPHSYAQTVDAVCFGAAPWAAQACRELAAGLDLDSAATPSHDDTSPARAPSAAARVALACKSAWRAVRLRLGYLFRCEHWNVGILDEPIAGFADGMVARGVRWLPFPPAGRFAADPFGLRDAAGLALCCEEFDYRDRRGFLSAMRAAERPGADGWKAVIREPYHLSYPYLIQHEGRVYCCPEMSESGDIALYEARNFPFSWERRTTLVAGFAAADSTIFRYAGRWWLFCTDAKAPNRNLHVFYADDLFGPWTPHARNPVKIDVRSARPGGTPFVKDGRLYRPAQDCAGAYGRRIAIAHVRELTPTEFDETVTAWVEPDPDGPCRDGLHTLSAAGDATLVDGKYHRFVARECLRTLARYARVASRALGAPAQGK